MHTEVGRAKGLSSTPVNRGSSLPLRNYVTVSLSCCYSRKRKAPLFYEFITATREHLNHLLPCGEQ